MIKHYLPVASAALALAVLTGCVDDKYDLKDIDQTVQVEVKDLTIPLNVDAVTLSTLFDLDEDDPDAVVKVVDGVYAIEKRGSYASADLSIDFKTVSGFVGPAATGSVQTGGVTVPGGQKVTFPFTLPEASFGCNWNTVPSEVLSIRELYGDFDINFTIAFNGASNISKFSLKNLVLALPKGLSVTPSAGTYDPKTGNLTVPAAVSQSGSVVINLHGTSLDFVNGGGTYDPATHTAAYNSGITVKEGTIEIDGSDVSGALPAELTISSSSKLSAFIPEKFSGDVTYNIEDVNVSPVTLDDLPDILSKEGTRISILNPQIYLNLANPVGKYGLTARTGFRITSTFPEDRPSAPVVAELDAPGYFTIEAKPEANYLLSPKAVSNPLAGFANPIHVPYAKLSDILMGNGLPSTLNIDLIDPIVPAQSVNEFPLTNYGKIKGEYVFYAPIALGAGSQIVYNDTQDGWADEDLNAVTIESMEISMDVSSNVPFSLKLSGYPIGTDGKQINNVEVTGADIPANAQAQKVTIRTTGTIQKLDGFEYTATALVPENMTNPLAPEQNIRLENIRVKVSGHYTKDLAE